MSQEQPTKTFDVIFGIFFILTAMFFSGWIYMLVISLFNPISFSNALMISLIINAIALAFNHGRTMSGRR